MVDDSNPSMLHASKNEELVNVWLVWFGLLSCRIGLRFPSFSRVREAVWGGIRGEFDVCAISSHFVMTRSIRAGYGRAWPRVCR